MYVHLYIICRNIHIYWATVRLIYCDAVPLSVVILSPSTVFPGNRNRMGGINISLSARVSPTLFPLVSGLFIDLYLSFFPRIKVSTHSDHIALKHAQCSRTKCGCISHQFKKNESKDLTIHSVRKLKRKCFTLFSIPVNNTLATKWTFNWSTKSNNNFTFNWV